MMLLFIQENCNLLVSNEYLEKTRRSMAMLSEKEHSFELIEVLLLSYIYNLKYISKQLAACLGNIT